MSQTSDVIRKSIIRQSIAGHNCRSIYENLCVAFSGSNLTLQVKIIFHLKKTHKSLRVVRACESADQKSQKYFFENFDSCDFSRDD